VAHPSKPLYWCKSMLRWWRTSRWTTRTSSKRTTLHTSCCLTSILITPTTTTRVWKTSKLSTEKPTPRAMSNTKSIMSRKF
jgi:hypothetical protein